MTQLMIFYSFDRALVSAPREPSFLLQIQGPFLRASRYVKYEMLSFCILAATERDLQTDLRHVSCIYSPCTQCLNSSFSPVLLRCDCDRIVSNRGGWSGSFSFRQCAGLRDNTQVRKRWESTNLLHGLFTHLDTFLTRGLSGRRKKIARHFIWKSSSCHLKKSLLLLSMTYSRRVDKWTFLWWTLKAIGFEGHLARLAVKQSNQPNNSSDY